MNRFVAILASLLTLSFLGFSQSIAQFRGPDRNGVFPETGLLKSWPEGGPNLLWSREDLDRGFASVSVTDDAVYLAGLEGKDEYLTVLDLEGNTLWRLRYGGGTQRTQRDTRCTPTVEGDKIYLISGQGEVVCIDNSQRKIVWSVPAFKKFQGEFWQWEIAESPLIVDDKVIYTPGGNQTSMVALNKSTGETVWQTESLKTPSAFVSPILIEIGGRKIIVGVLTEHIVGVDRGPDLSETPLDQPGGHAVELPVDRHGAVVVDRTFLHSSRSEVGRRQLVEDIH